MTPVEARAAWVSALRSGNYEQGKNVLRSEDEFCCLGVACEVFLHNTGKGEWVLEPDHDHYRFQSNVDDNGSCYILPTGVMNWLGLARNTGELLSRFSRARHLADLNDEQGWDFNQIADMIEQGEVLLSD